MMSAGTEAQSSWSPFAPVLPLGASAQSWVSVTMPRVPFCYFCIDPAYCMPGVLQSLIPAR